jgi:hypothetical protein
MEELIMRSLVIALFALGIPCVSSAQGKLSSANLSALESEQKVQVAKTNSWEDSTRRSNVPQTAVSPQQARGAQLLQAYASLPLSFEVNRGQAGPDIQFLSRAQGLALFLGSSDATLLIGAKDLRAPRRQSNPETTQDVAVFFSLASGILSGEPAENELHSGSSAASHLLRMSLVGARSGLQGVGVGALPGKANYFIGDDPKNWRTGLETYAKVKYEAVYPGIDLLYYGNQQRLEYDFVLAPGSSPKQIELAFEGADHARIDPQSGDLVLDSGGSGVRFQKPLIYQIDRESSTGEREIKRPVDGEYTLEAGNHIGFKVGAYDSAKPLVIDPVLSFFTYLGGMLTDFALHVAADSTGVYVTGVTVSPDFPTASPFSSNLHATFCGSSRGFPCPDAFVTKFKPDGSGILYSTYLGGSGSDIGLGIAVDSNQQAYVVGETESTNFPTTTSGFQNTAPSKLARAFLTKLNSSGSLLLYSTFLGGTPGSRGAGNDLVNDTAALGVAVDGAGHAYLAGYTRSNSLPSTAGVVQPSAGGNSGAGGVQCHSSASGQVIPCSDGFVAKFDTTASGSGSLLYATYLGGSYYDVATGIGIDSTGNAYVVGATLSDDFPVVSAFQASRVPGRCAPTGGSAASGGHVCASAFVAALSPGATALVYSSYLGGTGDTAALGVAVDSSGNAYLTGATNAADFPVTSGAAQQALATASCSLGGKAVNCPDAFVAKVSPAGSLSYATLLGGTGIDIGFGIAVDSAGDAYVAGLTNSSNFPTVSALQPALAPGSCPIRIFGTSFNLNCPDAFVTEVDPAGATWVFSTYLGGSNVDFAASLALDSSSNVYVAGGTISSGLATPGAFQTQLGSKGDAFLLKIAPGTAVAPTFKLVPATTGGASSVAVTAGQTATYNLQINPAGGFTGTVSFTCTGAPAKTTCNPPTPVSVSGNSTVPFMVTATTTAASGLPPAVWRVPNTRVPVWPVAYLGVVFLIFVLAAKRSLAVPNWRFSVWSAGLVLVGVSLLAGCGGGGGSNTGTHTVTPGTQAGTYTLTLTGTSGSVSQNVSLTLVVH